MTTYFIILAIAMIAVSIPIIHKIATDNNRHLKTLMILAGTITAIYTISTFIYILYL